VIVLLRRFVITRHFPLHRTGRLVEAGEPGFALMHANHHHGFFRQHRRRAMIPIQRVAAKRFNQIGLPPNFSGEIQRGEVAALEISEHALTISGGGSVASGTVAMFAGAFRAKLSAPQFLAGPIKSQTESCRSAGAVTKI
jgi:hypothetical protein